eukprot:SAG22_NODE_829_length_6953_cov_1.693026_2_plen_250_part_00
MPVPRVPDVRKAAESQLAQRSDWAHGMALVSARTMYVIIAIGLAWTSAIISAIRGSEAFDPVEGDRGTVQEGTWQHQRTSGNGHGNPTDNGCDMQDQIAAPSHTVVFRTIFSAIASIGLAAAPSPSVVPTAVSPGLSGVAEAPDTASGEAAGPPASSSSYMAASLSSTSSTAACPALQPNHNTQPAATKSPISSAGWNWKADTALGSPFSPLLGWVPTGLRRVVKLAKRTESRGPQNHQPPRRHHPWLP